MVLTLENVKFLHCEGAASIAPKVEETIKIKLSRRESDSLLANSSVVDR